MHFEPFAISSAIYTKLVFRGYFARYWWLYALPLSILIILTFYNINFLYTILMLCFIVFPMALIMVYFWYLLTGEIGTAGGVIYLQSAVFVNARLLAQAQAVAPHAP